MAQDLEPVACEALVAAPGSRGAPGEQTTLGRLRVLSKTPGLCHGSEWRQPATAKRDAIAANRV
jgi:hypothetical protein